MLVGLRLGLASFQLSRAYNVNVLNLCVTKCEPSAETPLEIYLVTKRNFA